MFRESSFEFPVVFLYNWTEMHSAPSTRGLPKPQPALEPARGAEPLPSARVRAEVRARSRRQQPGLSDSAHRRAVPVTQASPGGMPWARPSFGDSGKLGAS